MTDPDAVLEDGEYADEEYDENRKRRRGAGVLAAALLIVLLLFCTGTQARIWTTDGGKQARFVVRNLGCVQCHTDLIPDFNKPAVHNPFAQKECTACHTAHGKKVSVTVVQNPGAVWRRYYTAIRWLPLKWWYTISEGTAGRIGADAAGAQTGKRTTVEAKGKDSELVLPEQELCWMCHGSMGSKLSDPYPHQPFVAGRCTNCHDPHSSDYSALLVVAPDRICVTCHPIGEEIRRAQAHPPVKNGQCIECHDPHASQFKGVLVASQRDLCYRCHASVASKDGMPVQHAPFANANCTGCHEPHGSDHRPLLVSAQPDLCYKCHPGTADQFAASSSHPVGIDMTCASCHDPHAAQYPGLIAAQDNTFCYGCHDQVRPIYQDSAHEVILCIRCHTPHGSGNAPMLLAANPPLCLKCHPAKDFDDSTTGADRNNHPVRPAHYDVNAKKNLNCTTSCHNPHGTKNNRMLRYFSAPDDGGCLMCHAVTKGKRVSIDF